MILPKRSTYISKVLFKEYYMAANVEIISEHTSFMELIEGGGAFVRDLWKRVVPKKPAGDMIRLDG